MSRPIRPRRRISTNTNPRNGTSLRTSKRRELKRKHAPRFGAETRTNRSYDPREIRGNH
ncbi:Response regulator receiver protein [Anopheles sinensis]|uniref:Response regulator receiver protein n=1 Tax=Anopheles sinensis TaxID=74873 RepID=A0A084WKS8_ANOSI|nr:Response regulator receiver protein [Anopheles sinensis]